MKTINKVIYLLLLIILGLWITDSLNYGETLIFSKDSKIKEIKEYDELFGTETIKTEIDNGFWLGLMPGDDSFSIKSILAVIPLSGILIFLRIITFLINKRKRNNYEKV